MNNIREHLLFLVDYIALVYHEARNVRHLIQERAVQPESWKYLIALPVNRNKAWEAIEGIRSKAQKVVTVRAVLLLFERRFKVTLDQLEVLYDNAAWHNAAYGGNAWKAITKLVWVLRLPWKRASRKKQKSCLQRFLRLNTTLVPLLQNFVILMKRFDSYTIPTMTNNYWSANPISQV